MIYILELIIISFTRTSNDSPTLATTSCGSWSYNTELSPLVRYNGSPNFPITGAKGFSLQTPCSLHNIIAIQDQKSEAGNDSLKSIYETAFQIKMKLWIRLFSRKIRNCISGLPWSTHVNGKTKRIICVYTATNSIPWFQQNHLKVVKKTFTHADT